MLEFVVLERGNSVCEGFECIEGVVRGRGGVRVWVRLGSRKLDYIGFCGLRKGFGKFLISYGMFYRGMYIKFIYFLI